MTAGARQHRLVCLPGGGDSMPRLHSSMAPREVRPGTRSHVAVRHQHPSTQPAPDPNATRTLTVNALEAPLILTTLAKSPSVTVQQLGMDLALQWARFDSKPAPRGGA